MNLKNTQLLPEHKKLGARCAPFGGWLMPIQYEGIIAEHNWTRGECSVFDIGHMGEFIVDSETENCSLNKIVTVNISAMPLHSCKYGFMLNPDGGIIDDIIVYRIKTNKWMIVVNAATTENDYQHLMQNITADVKIENISKNMGKLDLQGPKANSVLRNIVGAEIEKLEYYNFDYFSVLGEKIIISRTGYTGELGYELYMSNDKILALWQLLLTDNNVKPAGLGARDTLRLEVSYPLYSQDIDTAITPLESGFEKLLDFNKNFIGKEALLNKKASGILKKLVYFITESRRAPRHNYAIFNQAGEIGIVTSGSFSPSLACGIGMGYIDINHIQIGSEIILKDKNIELKAKIVEKPFYKQGTARA